MSNNITIVYLSPSLSSFLCCCLTLIGTALSFFNGSVSPMHLLRDSTSNARWLEENINDFSLTSLLGHLDDFDATRDILVSSVKYLVNDPLYETN